MIPSHVKEAIEHMIDDCAQTDYEDFQQIDIGCVERWLKAESDPITPEALEAAGWEHHLSYDYYSLSIGTLNIGINPGNNIVVLYQDNNTIYVPGCTTMQQLAALVEMLGGTE